MATHSSILSWEIPCTEEPGGLTVLGVTKGRTRLSEHINVKCLKKIILKWKNKPHRVGDFWFHTDVSLWQRNWRWVILLKLVNSVYEFIVVTKYHQFSTSGNRNVLIHTILKGKNPRPQCWQDSLLLRALSEQNLSHASPMRLVVAGNVRTVQHIAASLAPAFISTRHSPCRHVCLSLFGLLLTKCHRQGSL